jgi:hypothetical protein
MSAAEQAEFAETAETDDQRDFGEPEGEAFDDEGPDTDDSSSPDEQ